MIEIQRWADPAPPAEPTWPLSIGIGSAIVAVRDSTLADAIHPATVLVLDFDSGYARVLVPPEVCPEAREILVAGQRVRVQVDADSWPTLLGARLVATEIQLIGTYH